MTVTPITENLHAAPDPEMVEEIARYGVEADATLHRDFDDDWPGGIKQVSAQDLAAEYALLIRAADGLGSVETGCVEVICPGGDKLISVVELQPGDHARALLTTALRSLALRRAALQAAHDFAAVLWMARRETDPVPLDDRARETVTRIEAAAAAATGTPAPVGREVLAGPIAGIAEYVRRDPAAIREMDTWEVVALHAWAEDGGDVILRDLTGQELERRGQS